MTPAFVAKKGVPRIFLKLFPKGSEVCLCHKPKVGVDGKSVPDIYLCFIFVVHET